MFQIKTDHNTNLILILPHRHFQEDIKVPFAKNTGVEALKLRYRYAVIGFVCGSSTGTRIAEKWVIGILSTNLFVV